MLSSSSEHFTYFVSCPKNIEPLLAQELSSLGIKNSQQTKQGLRFQGGPQDFLQVIFYSRLASRIYLQIKEFSLKNAEDLYQKCTHILWQDYLTVDQTFKVQTLFDHKLHFNSPAPFLSLKVKDAICDHFQEHVGRRPSVKKFSPDQKILLHLSENRIGTLLLDLTTNPLSNRGYRHPKAPTPLRENLAAALIDSMNWDMTSEKFIDLMCGSGTMLIEAAIKKLELPPSYLKCLRWQSFPSPHIWSFPFQPWFKKSSHYQFFEKETGHIVETFQKILESENSLRIVGQDRYGRVLSIAREQVMKSQLEDFIVIKKGDALAHPQKDISQSLLFCNPPYGKRLEEQEEGELASLYYQLGENLKKNFKNNKAYIFTGNLEMRKKIQLRTKERLPFFNGNIDCRLLYYELY